MKQRITVEQLRELTPEQQERLRVWWKPENGDYFTTQYGENRWSYNNMVGACVGYHNCELTIDDGDNPSEQPEVDSLPLLSIGQMIELLQDKVTYFSMHNMFAYLTTDRRIGWGVMKPQYFDIRADELCDALWEAVKAAL
jgi:hypothetical protein